MTRSYSAELIKKKAAKDVLTDAPMENMSFFPE